MIRQLGNIVLSRGCKGWGDWGNGVVVDFVSPEGFKKNTAYIPFLRSICFGVEGCNYGGPSSVIMLAENSG
jgi:hypothetical protein